MKAFERVNIARSPKRITSTMFIKGLCDEFIELHGDRSSKDDEAIIGGIGKINDKIYTIIGVRKGKNLEENMRFNFGMPSPEGYRKALRLMKQAEKFNRPIIIFVDTPGAYCGVEAEEKGQGEAIAKNLMEMAIIKVPVISIITGEGGSGGALALAAGDRVWMLENSVYSILSPEGFASILWKDATKAKEAAEVMKITSYDLKELNVIDDIIKEEENLMNDEKVQKKFIAELKEKLIKEFENLDSLTIEELLENRYSKFRNIGM